MKSVMNTTKSSNPSNLQVFTYTRAEALADGVLLDVTPLAREAGFQIPVALTVGLWAAYGAPGKTPAGDQGTVWDVIPRVRLCLAACRT